MTILQMRAEIEDIDEQIGILTKTREELRMKIARRVCPHKPGDRFRKAGYNKGLWEVVEVCPGPYGHDYSLSVALVRKDGSLGRTTNFSSWDFEQCEREDARLLGTKTEW